MSAGYLTRVVVLAKSPIAGRCKTRLTPPYTPDQAAAIARASLQDTLHTVSSLVQADEEFDAVICLDGEPGSWLPAGMRVIPQCTGGHDERIADAIEQSARFPGRPEADAVVLVGMDTPQMTLDLLHTAAEITRSSDSVLAPAHDGGWWLLGLQRRYALRARDVVTGVPTSTPHTGALQRKRLRESGLSVGALPYLRDIDTASDLEAVLRDISQTAGTHHLTRVVRAFREADAA